MTISVRRGTSSMTGAFLVCLTQSWLVSCITFSIEPLPTPLTSLSSLPSFTGLGYPSRMLATFLLARAANTLLPPAKSPCTPGDNCCSSGDVIGIPSAEQLYWALQLAGIRSPLACCRSASARKAMHSPALWLTPSAEGPVAASFFIKLSLQAQGLSGRHRYRHWSTSGRCREPLLTHKQVQCQDSRSG